MSLHLLPRAARLARPAPLPSLPAAFARRAAILGALVAPMALAGPTMAAPEVIRPDAESRNVLDVVRDAYAELAKLPRLNEPERDTYAERAATTRAGELILLLSRTPSTGRADLALKAGLYVSADEYDVDNLADLGTSIARDVVKIDGGRR